MQVLTVTQGFILLAIFFVLMLGISLWFVGYAFSKENFLAAGRKLGLWQSSFSIASSWIWAPALFIASQKAYLEGTIGVFWFIVPNIACLIIFSEFAVRLRERMPMGYTLSEYMKVRYSGRVQTLYIIQLAVLSMCSFAVQLFAGGLIFSTLTGMDFLTVTLILSGIALSYSLVTGLKASVVTDHLQLIVIFVVCAVAIPWTFVSAGGWETFVAGLGGVSGEYRGLFSMQGKEVFLTFGLATTIGLLAGPFGDQSFWQRAMATERRHVRKAFIWGAIFFGIVPLSLSVLGFIGAGAGIVAVDPQLINIQVILDFMPMWIALPFVFMLLSGLVSTLDSCLCAISSLTGGDIATATESENPVIYARIGMVALALIAVIIANIPGMQILYLFLFYGTLRASVLLPTVMTLLFKRISERGVFWGILGSFCLGLPIFAYGNFNGLWQFIVAGSLITVLFSGAVVAVKTFLEREYE